MRLESTREGDALGRAEGFPTPDARRIRPHVPLDIGMHEAAHDDAIEDAVSAAFAADVTVSCGVFPRPVNGGTLLIEHEQA